MANTYHQRGKKIQGYSPREHPNYYVWAAMKSRCDNPKQPSYGNYGGRGISYCDRWKNFEMFCVDMGTRPSPHHTLERINNEGGYHPNNCIWADRFAQAKNRRTFKNNTSGARGVSKTKGGRYIARCQYENQRYKLAGSFESPEKAESELLKFYDFVARGEYSLAFGMLERKPRYDSSTGVRGITKSQTGYVVRVTCRGSRRYLGHYLDFEEAKRVLHTWKQENK